MKRNWHDAGVAESDLSRLRAGQPETGLEWRFLGAESEWYERHTVSQDLPKLATDALVADWDSPTLRVLAGRPASDYYLDLGDLLAKTLQELGREVPSALEARWNLVQFFAWQIVTGERSPIEGARRIERIHWWEAPAVDVAADFGALDDEWGAGWGRSNAEVDQAIRDLAQEVLTESQPR